MENNNNNSKKIEVITLREFKKSLKANIKESFKRGSLNPAMINLHNLFSIDSILNSRDNVSTIKNYLVSNNKLDNKRDIKMFTRVILNPSRRNLSKSGGNSSSLPAFSSDVDISNCYNAVAYKKDRQINKQYHGVMSIKHSSIKSIIENKEYGKIKTCFNIGSKDKMIEKLKMLEGMGFTKEAIENIIYDALIEGLRIATNQSIKNDSIEKMKQRRELIKRN